jgi:hypothetical protein
VRWSSTTGLTAGRIGSRAANWAPRRVGGLDGFCALDVLAPGAAARALGMPVFGALAFGWLVFGGLRGDLRGIAVCRLEWGAIPLLSYIFREGVCSPCVGPDVTSPHVSTENVLGEGVVAARCTAYLRSASSHRLECPRWKGKTLEGLTGAAE